jgi:HEAT repeat protein
VRQRAAKKLEALGVSAHGQLRRSLARTSSVELRQRLERILARLEQQNQEVCEVITVLGKIGPKAKKAAPVLIATLRDADKPSAARQAAAKTLGRLGKGRSKKVVAALSQALTDKVPEVRSCAVDALGQTGAAARRAIPALIRALRDKDFMISESAAGALGRLGPCARQALPALIKQVKHKGGWKVGAWGAIRALGQIAPHSKAAMRVLIKVIKADRAKFGIHQAFAAQVLGKMGPAARKAVPALIRLLLAFDGGITSAAEKALPRIDPHWASRGAVPVFVRGLKSKDTFRRQSAAIALARLGPGAKKAVPYLVPLLKDEEDYVRLRAAQALGAIGPAAKAAVPGLRRLLEDDEDFVRESATKALKQIRK